MNKTLAQNGLQDLNLVATETTKVGTQAAVVSSACKNLSAYSANLDTFIKQLEAKKTEIMSDWKGAAADQFDKAFPELITSFKQVPTSIDSIVDWATDVANAYDKVDQETNKKLQQILGGAQ